MIGRRSFLGALMGAPIAGPGMVKEAAKGVAGMASGSVESAVFGQAAVGIPEWEEPSMFDKLFRRAQSRLALKREVAEKQVRYMPLHIQTKKSWSPAFKQHVLMEYIEDQREDDPWLNDDWSDAFKRKMIKKAGLDL